MLLKSLVSSAARGSISITSGVSERNSAAARSRARALVPDTICGSVEISSSATPSATRSGQKATSTSMPSRASAAAMRSVVPGYTVLRSTKSCPLRRNVRSAAIRSS